MPFPTKIQPYQINLEGLVNELQIQTGAFPEILTNFAALSESAVDGDFPYFNSSNDFNLLNSTEDGRNVLQIAEPLGDAAFRTVGFGSENLPTYQQVENAFILKDFTNITSQHQALDGLGIDFASIPAISWTSGQMPFWTISGTFGEFGNFTPTNTTVFGRNLLSSTSLTGFLTGNYLVRTNNLSDLVDQGIALSNLGIQFEDGTPSNWVAGNQIPVWNGSEFFPERLEYFAKYNQTGNFTQQQVFRNIVVSGSNRLYFNGPAGAYIQANTLFPNNGFSFYTPLNGSFDAFGGDFFQLNPSAGNRATFKEVGTIGLRFSTDNDVPIDFLPAAIAGGNVVLSLSKTGISFNSSVNFAGGTLTQSGIQITNRLTSINNCYWVTGHSGGGTGRLDGLLTSGASAEWPLNCVVVINPTGAMPTAFRLINGTSGTHSSYSTVRPQDYDATLNAKYWNSISLG